MIRKASIGVFGLALIAGCMDTGNSNQKPLSAFANLETAGATAAGNAVVGLANGTSNGFGSNGACCLPAHEDNMGNIIPGGCDEVTRDECESRNGNFFDDTPCSQAPCVQPIGACCLPAHEDNMGNIIPGGCDEITRDACERRNGSYSGDGTSCDTSCGMVTTGACCLPAHEDNMGNIIPGGCDETTQDDCEARNGAYSGDGTSCDTSCGMVTTGACCLPAHEDNMGNIIPGGCDETTQDDCEARNGSYSGDGTSCDTSCGGSVREACCLRNGTCMMFLPSVCVGEGGTPGGSGSNCMNTSCTPGDDNGNDNGVGNDNENDNGVGNDNENGNGNDNMNDNGADNGNDNMNDNGVGNDNDNGNGNDNMNDNSGTGTRAGIRR